MGIRRNNQVLQGDERHGFYGDGTDQQNSQSTESGIGSKHSTQLNQYFTYEDYCIKELLPIALQVGMSLDEFWYEDMYLLEVYVKAYYEKVRYESWLNGYYSYTGHIIALANAFGSKGQKELKYPDFKDQNSKEEKEAYLPKNNNDYLYLAQCY